MSEGSARRTESSAHTEPTPHDAREALEEALRLHTQGDFDAAQVRYDALLARQPDHLEAAQLSGLCLLTAGHAERAAARFRRAIELDPRRPIAHVKLGLALKMLGQVEDALIAFDRALAIDPRYFEAWMERGITQAALDRPVNALACFDHAISIEPAHPGAMSNRGDTLRRLGRIEEALACFDHALAIDPGNVDVLLNRSTALRDARRNLEALDCVERILAIDPSNTAALNNQGNARVNLRRYDDAIESFTRAIDLDPGFAGAWINLANTLVTIGRHDEARVASDRALALAPNWPSALWNAGLHDLRTGRYATGWERYEARWQMSGFSLRRYKDIPLWLGKEDLRGKRILLWHEQGLGDTIHFCRYAIMVAALGARVVLEVQASLKTLIASSFKGMIDVVAHGDRVPSFDFATPLMSLPLAFATTASTIPFAPSYLKADPVRIEAWRARLGPMRARRRIGIACAGNPKHKGDAHRSVDLGLLVPLAQYGELIIVQKDRRRGDQATLDAHPGIVNVGPSLGDFSDTAALVAQLDLVISVDTSLAHLAGALGKPVWVLLPPHSDWRWELGRDDNPWYPSARLFRQRTVGAWGELVTRVCDALAALDAE
ncbi:tetratricopeptide repeat protein [Pararobbsia silviterrae]|nr:tetratricopeptide repeat-containing glycosyltransferase family protein [Pararobbsia silviterrae]